jgi:hypothetical protein
VTAVTLHRRLVSYVVMTCMTGDNVTGQLLARGVCFLPVVDYILLMHSITQFWECNIIIVTIVGIMIGF